MVWRNTVISAITVGLTACGSVQSEPDGGGLVDAAAPGVDGAASDAGQACAPLIAYTQTGAGLFVIHPDGTGLASVVSNGSERSPVWSPDGAKLAFLRAAGEGSDTTDIFSVGVDGTGLVNLTNAPGDDTGPVWSPDGTRIAFNSEREGDGGDVYVMNADGSEARRLADQASDPTWSPDGSQVAYMTWIGGRPQIYVVNVDGNPNPTNLTNSTGRDSLPRWSPTGNQIVFASLRGSSQVSTAYIMDANGSQQRALVPSLGGSDTPLWSPDGAHLLVGSYTVDPDGGNLVQVFSPPSEEVSMLEPSWSPDGSHLAFIRSETGVSQDLYRVNSDGSGLQQLTDTSEFAERGAAWAPCAP